MTIVDFVKRLFGRRETAGESDVAVIPPDTSGKPVAASTPEDEIAQAPEDGSPPAE